MYREIVAIDVGTNSIKALAGKVEDGHIDIITSANVLTKGCVKGVYTDYEALAESVQEAVNCILAVTAISGPAVIGISGNLLRTFTSKGCIAPLSNNEISKDDMKRVQLAATLAAVSNDLQVLHFEPNYYLIDGVKTQPYGKKGSKLEVEAHIVTSPREQLDKITDVFTKHKIKLEEIVSSVILGSKEMVQDMQKPSCLTVDIGDGSIDIVLYHQGNMVRSGSLPVGGHYITQDIMQGLDVTYLHAEEIKRYYARLDTNLLGRNVILDCNDFGTKDKQIAYDFLANIIESRIAEIVALLYEYLGLLENDQYVEEILLTGGCACMPTVRSTLEQTFHLPVKLYQPKLVGYSNPAYTACFGILSYVAKKEIVIKKNEEGKIGLLSFLKKIF